MKRFESKARYCDWRLAHALALTTLLAAVGCQNARLAWLDPPTAQPAAIPADPPAAAPLDQTAVVPDLVSEERSRLRDVEFVIILLRVPHEHDAAIEQVWNYVRPAEEVFDVETATRLRGNGLRAGVGHEQWWPPIHAALVAMDDVFSSQPEPWRIPQRFPFNLELDDEPRERTLFALGRDGVLSGGTWPQSRTALQLTHMRDPVRSDRVRLSLIPLVRRERPGWRRIRTAAGIWQVPRDDGRLFVEAGLTATLGPREFLVVGPAANVRAPNLIGSALLARDADGLRYDYHVIIKPDLADVVARR